jgi:hypothetical protein
VYEAERSGRVPFAIWDPSGYADNTGKLNVRVLDLGLVKDTMTWKVPAAVRSGATSPGLLQGGKDYLVTVSGTWQDSQGAVDAECAVGSDGNWRRDADSYDMLAGDWSYDSLAPRISGVRATPLSGGEGCDPGHTYTWVHRAERTSPLNVRVSDPYGHAGNRGALTVTVAPYSGSAPAQPTPEPTPLPEPDPVVAEALQVDSRSAQAVHTKQEYPAGTALRVTATGTYLMRDATEWIAADAECTSTARDINWRSSRFEGSFGGATAPLGDVVVNGAIITWAPSDGSGACDREDHTYSYDLTTTKAGPLWFVIADSDYGDNLGSLELEVEMR